jgi:Mn-dependent DtxR family transcriptional regulator
MSELSNDDMKVLKAFQDIGKPAGPKAVAEESGLPKENVSKIIKKLKTDGYVMSPKRCFYTLDDKSKDVL